MNFGSKVVVFLNNETDSYLCYVLFETFVCVQFVPLFRESPTLGEAKETLMGRVRCHYVVFTVHFILVYCRGIQ